MTTGKPEDKELTRQIEAEKQIDNLVTVGWPFKCPVCNGTGIVSIPPGIPGDVAASGYFDATGGPYTCPACTGSCLVWATMQAKSPFGHGTGGAE
jgi:hypothetical protein